VNRTQLVALALAFALPACSSAKIAGGHTVMPGKEHSGVTLARYTVGKCRDEAGRLHPSSRAEVRLLREVDGKVVLVEARDAYDVVVVENVKDAKNMSGERIFDLELKSAESAPYLREYRLPETGNGPGRFFIIDRFTDERVGSSFVVAYRRFALDCELDRSKPDAASGPHEG
jgi:hypothetical protein